MRNLKRPGNLSSRRGSVLTVTVRNQREIADICQDFVRRKMLFPSSYIL
jgi:hypothetical protein